MELIQVLQSYSIIGLQVFGEVKHMKTSFSLLAYVNRFVITYNTINIHAKKKTYFCTSCINPLIYGFMSKNFRRSFTEALCRCDFQVRSKDTAGGSNEKR